jgi:16S rRNA (uracil1498-N3)-methyltransferase
MAHLYRVSDNAPLVAGSTVTLEGDEARHASSVARLTPGENVALTDGRGLMAQSVVQESSAQRVTLVVASVEDVAPLTPEVWLVQALAKGDRDERAVEACTELGVDRIIPWQAARSVARWSGAKIEKSVARWQRIAGEASKQSLRAWVPGVENMVELQQLVDMASSTRMVLLEPMASLALHQAIPCWRSTRCPRGRTRGGYLPGRAGSPGECWSDIGLVGAPGNAHIHGGGRRSVCAQSHAREI